LIDRPINTWTTYCFILYGFFFLTHFSSQRQLTRLNPIFLRDCPCIVEKCSEPAGFGGPLSWKSLAYTRVLCLRELASAVATLSSSWQRGRGLSVVTRTQLTGCFGRETGMILCGGWVTRRKTWPALSGGTVQFQKDTWREEVFLGIAGFSFYRELRRSSAITQILGERRYGRSKKGFTPLTCTGMNP